MAKKTHELKIIPQYYNDILHGNKRFEVRKNDRDFQVGDILTLQEYSEGKYTGGYIDVKVTYILNDPQFCKEGYIVMGFRKLPYSRDW